MKVEGGIMKDESTPGEVASGRRHAIRAAREAVDYFFARLDKDQELARLAGPSTELHARMEEAACWLAAPWLMSFRRPGHWMLPPHPWSRNGHTYASDGRILIETSKPVAGVPESLRGLDQAVQLLYENYREEGEWKAVPAIDQTACGECGGGGCEDCNYVGMLETDESMEIGERLLHQGYLLLIARLPDAGINVTGRDEEPMSFRFRGGRGLLMPMRRRS